MLVCHSKPRVDLAPGDVLHTPGDCFAARTIKQVTQYGHCTFVRFEDVGDMAGGFKTIKAKAVQVVDG